MSSVEVDGIWYKRCMKCAGWTSYDVLLYEPPSPEHEHGLDICPDCATDTTVKQTFVTVKVEAS